MTFDQILAATSSAYNATLEERTAKNNARASQSAANAQVASSGNLLRIAMIGGAILLVIGGIIIFKRSR